MTTVQIPDEIAQQYEHFARTTGSSPDKMMRQALIEKLEDLEDIQLAEERIAAGLTPVSMEEMVKNLGLDD